MRNFNDLLAKHIYEQCYREISQAEFDAGGGWTLSSGTRSRFYFNLRPLTLFPVGLGLVAGRINLSSSPGGYVDYVGGLEVGAIPIVCALVSKFDVRGFYVRKNNKTHGEVGTVEGFGPKENVKGKTCWLVEDVSTTGASLERCVVAARDMGLIVLGASSVVDRGMGAAERMERLKVPYTFLFPSSLFTDAEGA